MGRTIAIGLGLAVAAVAVWAAAHLSRPMLRVVALAQEPLTFRLDGRAVPSPTPGSIITVAPIGAGTHNLEVTDAKGGRVAQVLTLNSGDLADAHLGRWWCVGVFRKAGTLKVVQAEKPNCARLVRSTDLWREFAYGNRR
ncbi:MAG: hypothetical protein JSR45_17760 [Proteobacteria bacterium]|nr:hypothetical protein [Pseudomonadota bacterium]